MRFIFRFIFVLLIAKPILGLKILKFTDIRKEGTGAEILNVKSKVVSDFTMCIDFVVTLIKDFRLLSNIGTTDLEILIPNLLDNIQIRFKGIWYLAYTNLVEPYNWGTFCLAYTGKIIFSKKHHIFGVSTTFVVSQFCKIFKTPGMWCLTLRMCCQDFHSFFPKTYYLTKY